MYKILVVGYSNNPGGIERFITNYCSQFDNKKVQVDILGNAPEPLAFEDKIKAWGGKIYVLNMPTIKKNPVNHFVRLKAITKKIFPNYDCVWFNTLDLKNIELIKMAKKLQVPRIIIHSHNSKWSNKTNVIDNTRHKINKRRIIKYGTDFWACSESAKEWLFPPELYSKVKIINNAIDVKKFEFDFNARKVIRNKYNMSDSLVLGNVGRLTQQKNQIFSLEIFQKLLKKVPSSKLVLLGQGEDEELLREKVKELKIEKNVIFAGVQKNINDWYSTFDLLLLTSLYEGLPLTIIEAQANGINIVANKTVIPTQAIINNNLKLLSLKDDPEVWANEILGLYLDKKLKRENKGKIESNFKKSGFDIRLESDKVQQLIIGNH
ncbi:glycosyltransferase family 1 protein [Lactobacillus hamsteri]|uniref:Glycosyl transferase family 1 domain-containing protein n=1 Tax=Lactobacillus hamsteri DSM 5661 = JCM 6256 TaxID=1423754 RepID=A0A0R1YBX6_9LACO|nr:glycosyltransferase [Lactobacillus hamsteri]KRM39920.1 hypothetical protein FC39_GL000921 [Lactobacillus hamsteri DSM 5661 = JCM 6256]